MAPGPPAPVPGVQKSKTNARKPSPPRPESNDAESTFQRKLEEIKRIRANSVKPPERRKVIVNGKPSIAVCNDWALFASSSGRQYYFNLKTLVNQWNRPPDWCDVQAGLAPETHSTENPPNEGEKLHQSSAPSNGGNSVAFKMKIKNNTRKAVMAETTAGEQFQDDADETNSNKDRLRDDDESSPKRSRKDSSCSSSSRSSSSSYSSRSSRSSSGRRPDPIPKPDMNLVLAAKAKIESQMLAVAAQYHSGPARATNPTWMTEYNFPAVLTRCKFPKSYDVLHEMQTNRGKKRNPVPIFDAAEFSKSEARRMLVIAEVKNPNNRNRLLSDKLGITAFKIPDELWESHFPQFQIDITDGVKLECRPHAFTEDDRPVYTRTGKVAKKFPYPEDIVRCHAVIQAWGTETCHCVYANKTYTIQRDDTQWQKDIEECKRFLADNGY